MVIMPPPTINGAENDTNNNSNGDSPPITASKARWPGLQKGEKDSRHMPKYVFDPDSCLVFYWMAIVSLAFLYNAWTIALRIAFPEIRQERGLFCLYYIDMLSDFIYLMDIVMQLRIAYLQDGIPVFEPVKIRAQYMSQSYFIQDVISVIPSQSIISLLPDALFGWCKYFFCTAGAARLTKLVKIHILYRFYDFAESFTSNPHLIRVLRLFLNLAITIHWIACLYYLVSENEGLGSNQWVYTNATDQQRFSRKYIVCLYWSTMTLTTIGNTSSPETDVEYIFTGIIFLTGVFVFATVMGNVGDVISSMNAKRQEFQAKMDHIQMYLTHKKVPASLQMKIKKWAEYTWSRTKATDESRLLNMLPERLRAEVAVHVHLDSLKKVKIFEQCETGFLCELVLKLRSQVFSPGDYVCRIGETGREMFIINHGKVEVLVPSPATNKDMVVAVLSEGNYFGEISLLRLDGVQNRRTADVRSIGYSELLCLSRRDLMAALVEYPEAKAVLEVQAKKRMKTNLQAQRAFSVDTLMKSSHDSSSSFDSGIGTKDERGHEVSEIKAMIEELKNANKAPGKTVWQLITKCEVLQARLGEKEKEVEDSKQRIRDLEQLLFSGHSIRRTVTSQPKQDIPTSSAARPMRPGIRVTKQYSQDLPSPTNEQPCYSHMLTSPDRIIPDLKITGASETSDDESEPSDKSNVFKEESCIKTSKITSVANPKPKTDKNRNFPRETSTSDASVTFRSTSSEENNNPHNKLQRRWSEEDRINHFSQNIRRSHSTEDGSFSAETSVDQKIYFNKYEQMSVTTSFKDELYVNDSFNFGVHTIPEENEEESEEVNIVRSPVSADFLSYISDDRNTSESTENRSPNSIYRDLDASDQEVKCVRPRLKKSASTSAELYRARERRSNFLTTKKLYSSFDGTTLDPYDSDSGINFQRLGSASFSDDSSSRRNSWNTDSEFEEDSEEDRLSGRFYS